MTPLNHCKVGEDLVCGRQVLRGDPVRTQRQDQRCGRRHQGAGRHCRYDNISVADPDPHVFGPSGLGSTNQMYVSGSGSGSFYHHAKIVRKTLIPTIL